MLTPEALLKTLFTEEVAAAGIKSSEVFEGGVEHLLRASFPSKAAAQEAVFQVLAGASGGFGQNAVQAILRHYPDFLGTLLKIVAFLEVQQQENLACATNHKGLNLLGLAGYFASRHLLPKGVLVPFLLTLAPVARASLLQPLILQTGLCVTRLLINTCPAALIDVLSLMHDLAPDTLFEIIGRLDARDQSMVTMMAQLAPDAFGRLLDLVKPLDVDKQCALFLPLFQNLAVFNALVSGNALERVVSAISDCMGERMQSLLDEEVYAGVTVQQCITSSCSPSVARRGGMFFATLRVEALSGSSHENADSAPHRHQSVARAGQ
ncbi:hypothetical protein Lgee_2131 [Legionella geestiana]|uniref:Uncharacterized protein n=1 Tax=Legionella geestiana TaxID=45065 RepID=A0A0W0TLF3_9GAMM|nr:hypothetical protein [Legionella geestiana]KTC96448.1 hypothetical protein Lgee_2131 [Legionella geestiana]QBS12494.1 hypothetical protein E4T54_06870 [Legionella geestiana]QDQ39792.1 hypothetical protein E3226_004995 [Legionella geestiana]STX55063.1 Uncharacterised protein [Legionella geestiana]